MTAVLDAVVAAAAGEVVAEATGLDAAVEKAAEAGAVEATTVEATADQNQTEQISEESKQIGADFRSVSIQEAKQRLVDTKDGKESSV